MALSDEQLNQLMQKYRLTPASNSAQNGNSLRGAALLDSLDTNSDSEQSKPDGFLKGLAKGIAKPFAEIGTSAYNVGSSVGKLAQGDVQGASQAIGQSRNVPFLGETKPAFTGQETTAGAAKKIAGYGADIGSTVLPVGGAGEILEQGAKGAIKQAVKQGAKYGAATGFAQSAGTELEKGDQGTLKQAAKSGALGAAIGAPLGAAAGFVGGKINNQIKNSVALKEEKLLNDALSVVKPELNKTQRVAALKAGQGEAQGLLQKIDINNPRDVDVANVVKGIVDSKKPVTENIKNVRAAIVEEANKLKSNLAQNNTVVNQKEVQSLLNNHKAVIGLKSDATLNKAYDLTKQRLMEIVNKNPKNLTGLLDSRIEFDNMVEKELGDIYKNPNSTPLKRAVTDLRGIINDYIIEKAPASAESLNKQSLMFRARDSMAEKGAKQVKTNVVQRFAKDHPTLTKTAKNAAILAGAGLGGREVINALK